MIADERRIAVSLLAVIVFLIAFGSLYPFSFSLAGASAFDRLGELSQAGATRSDVAANVLLYLPLGTSLAWLLAARFGSAAAVVATTLIAATLSFAIEFAQLYETRRVASLADLASNTAGAFAGAWLALALGQTRRRLHTSQFAGLLRHPVAAALLFSWIGYRLAPFVPVIDPAEWAAAILPLTTGDGFPPEAFLTHLLAWLVLGAACGRLAPARPMALLAGSMGVVLAGRIMFADIDLDAAELAGMAAALVLARPLARLPGSKSARLLAAALFLLIAFRGLVPFDFQLAQDQFAWLPFGESLIQYRAANLTDMFLRCFMNGALVWLLAQTGLSVLAATGLGAGAIFAIELLQTWLPAQTAEITDPLLAICAGSLIAVFEREGGRD